MGRAVVRLSWLLLAIAVAAGGVAAAVLLVADSRYSSEQAVDRPGGSELVAAVARSLTLTTAVTLFLDWRPGDSISSSAQGLVTEAPVGSVPIRCNRVVVEVDSRPRIAYCGPHPISSSLKASNTATRDLQEFFEFLARQDVLGNVELTSIRQRRDAIRWWQASVGQVPDGEVEPEDIVWIGDDDSDLVATMEVVAGEHVAIGEPLATLPSRVQAARILPVPNSIADAAFELKVGDLYVDVASGGVVSGLTDLESALQSEASGESPTTEVKATISLRSPQTVIAVPATSVIITASEACVLEAVADGFAARSVVPFSSAGEQLFVVSSELEGGTNVVIYPPANQPC